MESVLLYHTACPKCRDEGFDRTGNNLAVYSDGHQFCYRCKYTILSNKVIQYKQINLQPEKKVITLPSDIDLSIPAFAREWLEQYEFNNNTILNNKIMWSDKRQYLIFPYYINGNLESWQGRVFDPNEKEKRKWFSNGNLTDIIYTLGRDTPYLVLVESIISAIKVSRFCKVAPIFGSIINTERWVRLNHLSDRIIVWLDPDKQREAVSQSKTGELFVQQVSPLLTAKKPKDYSYDEIESILKESIN